MNQEKEKNDLICVLLTVATIFLFYIITNILVQILDDDIGSVYSQGAALFCTTISFVSWLIADYNMSNKKFKFSEISKNLTYLAYLYIFFEEIFYSYPKYDYIVTRAVFI